MAAREPHILITDRNYEKLMMKLEGSYMDEVVPLFEELNRASIVPEKYIPSDTVTMNSRVRFKDVKTNEESEVTIVFPEESNAKEGKISVVAPVGTALLGLRVGEQIKWPMPNGSSRTLEVLAIDYQPESAEDNPLEAS